MEAMPGWGVSFCVCLALVSCVSSSAVPLEVRTVNEAVEANLLKGFAVSADRNYPSFLRSLSTIFEVDRDRDLSISRHPYVTVDMQYSDSENTAAKNVAAEVGVAGSYGAFSGAATMQVSTSSSSEYKTVRIDSVAKATRYRVASKGAFRTHPEQFLSQNFKDTVAANSDMDRLEQHLGIFYAVGLNLGGEVKKTYIMEAMATDTESSVFAEITAEYGSAGMGVTGRASYSNEQRRSNKMSRVKQEWKANGGNSNIWLRKTFSRSDSPGALDAVVKEWAASIDDSNLYPSDFELRPMWELVKKVDKVKGDAFETHLKTKWKRELDRYVPTTFKSGYTGIEEIPRHYAFGSSYWGSGTNIAQKKNVMDGSTSTSFHTECKGQYQWIGVIFKAGCWVTSVKVVNGKFGDYSDRIDNARVYVKEGNREILCGRIKTRSSSSVTGQTYIIKCPRPIYGVGVVVYNYKETCTQLAELSAEGYCGMGECYFGADPAMPDYRGTVHTTVNGKTCQKWSEQSPHPHTHTPQNYPNKGLVGNHNFCRDPDGKGYGWCYTTDENTEWEQCEIEKCTQSECYEGNFPGKQDYRGTMNRAGDATCVNWTYTSFADMAKGLYSDHNFCRARNNNYLWCYTNKSTWTWKKCNVPNCN